MNLLRIQWQDLELALDMIGQEEELSSISAYFETKTGRTFITVENDESIWSQIQDELDEEKRG